MFKQRHSKIIKVFLTVLLLIAFSVAVQAATEKKGRADSQAAMEQAELQSQVMSFADRFLAIVSGAVRSPKMQSLSPGDHRDIWNISTYSMAAAITIAAESNPTGAFLDMLTMVTLGRIIFEEDFFEEIGPPLQHVVDAYRKAEKDIWQVSTKFLTPDQQKELLAYILRWRKNNPEIRFFPTVRFSDFSIFRGDTDMAGKKPGGLFSSVEKANQQVEGVRLLGERSMYLATRMPMLTGVLSGAWFSQLSDHPDMAKILNEIDKLTEVSERITVVAEQLPKTIAQERHNAIEEAIESVTRLTMATIDETAKKVSSERESAIKQLISEFSAERKRAMEDFIREEERLRGILTEARLTLAEGNALISSTDALVKNLNLEPDNAETKASAEPFDIKDYQATLKEATNTISQLHGLVRALDQIGMEKALPRILKTVETVEAHGERWVLFSFLLGIVLIVIFLVGAVIAALIYRHFAIRIYGPPSRQTIS